MLAVRADALAGHASDAGGADWCRTRSDNTCRNLDWTLMTYAAVVGLSYALGYYRESQARAIKEAQLETSLMEARLKTLEAELHPHFLFNTLHAISTLVHTNPERRDRMISRLSDLLRLTFDRSGRGRRPAAGGARVPAEVSRDRADALSGSPDGATSTSIPTRSTPRCRA